MEALILCLNYRPAGLCLCRLFNRQFDQLYSVVCLSEHRERDQQH